MYIYFMLELKYVLMIVNGEELSHHIVRNVKMACGIESWPKMMAFAIIFVLLVQQNNFVSSLECIKDYDSPHLEIFTAKPAFPVKNGSDNITLTCVVRPFEDGYFVRHSSLTVLKDSNKVQVAKIDKFALVEGSYNLTISLRRYIFANETSISVTCLGSMLSRSCANVTQRIILFDKSAGKGSSAPFLKHTKSHSLGIHEIIGITIGTVAIGAVAVVLLLKWKLSSKKQSVNMSSKLLSPESLETA
ncbi:uncharacterized protein LOC135682323 isoform X2 [Rhopilema esculentum]|uniref:uncharacterized protein LOC135682323 isoform X2 n=1 Tax=Rhopilema esculentum TaxID=499914 RepID=UPI0031E343D2